MEEKGRMRYFCLAHRALYDIFFSRKFSVAVTLTALAQRTRQTSYYHHADGTVAGVVFSPAFVCLFFRTKSQKRLGAARNAASVHFHLSSRRTDILVGIDFHGMEATSFLDITVVLYYG